MPRVTVVTPAYNAAPFVQQAVESVLGQTYGDLELVVVDDGSTDGTADLVAAYRDPRVRLVRLPHRGLRALAETYNAALAESRGELVAVLEGDDYWAPDKLEQQVRGFDDPAVVLSWGAGYEVDPAGRVLKVCHGAPVDGQVRRFTSRELFLRLADAYVMNPSSTVMARRSALDRIGGFRQDGSALAVDLPTWLLLLAHNEGAALFHGTIFGYWRRHPTQTSARFGRDLVRQGRRVVRDVVGGLDAPALASLGWTEALSRANRARWSIAAGRAALRRSRYATARRLNAGVVARGPGLSLRVKALSGLAAAALRLDLPSLWRRMRGRRP